MSISLTYDDDLSRVQVALSSIASDPVRVERSTNQLYWEVVRGGIALPVSGGMAAVDDYEFAADTQNFYRVLDESENILEQDSITPLFGFDDRAWLKSVRFPFLNQVVEIYDYSDVETPARAEGHSVSSRSFPVAVTDINHSMSMEMALNAETEDEVRKLTLSLQAGNIFFLHLPLNGHPSLPPRSFYFFRNGGRVERWLQEERRLVHMNITECAPPGPDVVGTTLTWGTVIRLYGNWNNLINANPTWADLLATVGSEDDLVVL